MNDTSCPIYTVDIREIFDVANHSNIFERYSVNRVITVLTRLAYTLYRWKDAPIYTTDDTVGCIKSMLQDDYSLPREVDLIDRRDVRVILQTLLPMVKNLVETAVGQLDKEYMIHTVGVDEERQLLHLSAVWRGLGRMSA